MKNKYYLCVDDLQGGCFAIGRIGDIEYWRKSAMEWCDADDNSSTYNYLKRLAKKEVIDFIQEFWQIEIKNVSYDFYEIYNLIENLTYNTKKTDNYIEQNIAEEKTSNFYDGFYSGLYHVLSSLQEHIEQKEV